MKPFFPGNVRLLGPKHVCFVPHDYSVSVLGGKHTNVSISLNNTPLWWVLIGCHSCLPIFLLMHPHWFIFHQGHQQTRLTCYQLTATVANSLFIVFLCLPNTRDSDTRWIKRLFVVVLCFLPHPPFFMSFYLSWPLAPFALGSRENGNMRARNHNTPLDAVRLAEDVLALVSISIFGLPKLPSDGRRGFAPAA